MNHRGSSLPLSVAFLATSLALAGPARGQSAAEHASHHPAPGGAGTPSPAPQDGMLMPAGGNPAQMAGGSMGATQPPIASGMTNPAPAPGAMSGNQPLGGGGMGAGMGEMMKQMGTPPRKEVYPSLMALPDGVMTPQQRAGIEQLAQDHMNAGTALLSSGLARLSEATSDQDYAAMEQATAQMRDGLAQFETGVAARRLLSEGTATRNLALAWFKREMNLASPVRPGEPRTLFGVTPFHLFTMVLLIGFALAMVGMYFFKMRRAAALFGRLEPDPNASPPGSSPPLSGASAPPAPAVPPPGGSSTGPVPSGDASRATG